MGLQRTNIGDALRLGLSAVAAAVVTAAVGGARADEPRKVTEPQVLSEPAEVTQVVDAFDEGDVFDLHLALGYQHSWKQAKIRRESSIDQPGLTSGGYTSDRLNIAEYHQEVSRLNTRADIGIYQDIALVMRLPIVLSDNRKLTGLDGSAAQQALVLQGLPGEQLFALPFKSPTRSGVEYLALGLDFAILNQFRDRTKPTWVAGFEVRFNVAEPMHACNERPRAVNVEQGQTDPQVKCADPSDINRDGTAGNYLGRSDPNYPLEGTNFSDRSAGVSRGTTALELHSLMSKRIKYIEPYAGFSALFEFPTGSSDYGKIDLEASLVNHPPARGSLFFGMSMIPWEIRDQFQRVTFDTRFTATFVSEGRDYSELFDALGSSDARSLRLPNYARYYENPDCPGGVCPEGVARSVADPSSRKVYFTGLTDVQQYAVFQLLSQFTWQAGEYIKFNLGASYTFTQSHLLTFDQACNPDFDDDPTQAGPCLQGEGDDRTATGIPNPNYRAVINVPGRRFSVDDSIQFDGWVNAIVMF